jgi:peptide chain release factor subunit 3
MRVECAGVICMEQFKLFPQMGRFTLRDEGNLLLCEEICFLILYCIF